MLTVFETELFTKLWPDYWTEEERADFVSWLATQPEIGDVIPKSGGVRKVRWKLKGKGKSGGVRVIYYNRLEDGNIWLLLMYAKSATESIPAHTLKQIKEELDK